jgi:uncharacterized membrane protein YheB (UPF0754 family)
MIEYNQIKGSSIPPESTEKVLPSKEDVLRYFENFFKKDVDSYMIYKKNNFNNKISDILKDFISKLENLIKEQNTKEEMRENINLIFSNIENNLKILENEKLIPNDKKIISFLMSYSLSKFFVFDNGK